MFYTYISLICTLHRKLRLSNTNPQKTMTPVFYCIPSNIITNNQLIGIINHFNIAHCVVCALNYTNILPNMYWCQVLHTYLV